MQTDRPVVPAPAIGLGAPYHPPALSQGVRSALPVNGLACRPDNGRTDGVHLEIFANRQTVVVPSGIGIAPPWQTRGAYVTGGRCAYAARTHEPTGLIEVEQGTQLTLGQLFDLWGQSLTNTQLAGFTARKGDRVTAFVNGRLWAGDARLIVLFRHAEIVLEIGRPVAPHTTYRFPGGL